MRVSLKYLESLQVARRQPPEPCPPLVCHSVPPFSGFSPLAVSLGLPGTWVYPVGAEGRTSEAQVLIVSPPLAGTVTTGCWEGVSSLDSPGPQFPAQ